MRRWRPVAFSDWRDRHSCRKAAFVSHFTGRDVPPRAKEPPPTSAAHPSGLAENGSFQLPISAMNASHPDVVIIGSGMGGATAAYAMASTGASILILEKGRQLPERPENRDARAIFQRGFFRPDENWYDAKGAPFNPGNYYVHGGNSKFYGAVLARYRAEDFDGVAHADGDAPPW